jgi:cytochrome P450
MDEAFSLNPFDEAFRRDPYPTYARARREHPIWAHDGIPIVSIFRHEDIQRLLRDPATWSSVFPPPPGLTADDLPPSMLVTDPPQHTRLRGLVSQAFTPRMIARLEPRMHEIARELVDRAITERQVDLVEALTYPLPVIVIAEIIGVPAEDRAQFKVWSDTLVANLGSAFLAPMAEEQIATQRRTRAQMEEYFARLVEERRREPREDLLSGLVAAELEGSRLSFQELMAMLVLILVAGNETTTTLIGNMVLELLAHPDALAALRARPELMPSAVDEVLRFSSPIQMDPRRAARATELCGRPIEEGQLVLGWLGSANRDEAAFPDPDTFDITRRDNRHLAFGFGPHYCLGASLATLETKVAIGALLERTQSFRRTDDDPLPSHPSFVFRAVTSLPLELEPAR